VAAVKAEAQAVPASLLSVSRYDLVVVDHEIA
jgi:hypothetical protein